jgi:hypothetical protein
MSYATYAQKINKAKQAGLDLREVRIPDEVGGGQFVYHCNGGRILAACHTDKKGRFVDEILNVDKLPVMSAKAPTIADVLMLPDRPRLPHPDTHVEPARSGELYGPGLPLAAFQS